MSKYPYNNLTVQDNTKLNPLVSIIMPLYNAEKYVEEAIQSIINQTYQNWELIIVNDGSTDNSQFVAERFESDKIKVITQKNKGASAARNLGLKVSKGEYIQFLDADDLLSNNKIEVQVRLLDGSIDKLAICNCVHFFTGKDPIKDGIYNDESGFIYTTDSTVDFLINLYGGNEVNEGGMVQPNSWLTPKSVIVKAGIWNEDLNPNPDDDGEFFCRVILKSKGIVYTPNCTNYYRKFDYNKSLSSKRDKKSIESIFLSAILKKNYIFKINQTNLAKKAFAIRFKNIAIYSYPYFKDISRQAENISLELNQNNITPIIGGKLIELIKLLFGWKVARYLQFYWYNLFNK